MSSRIRLARTIASIPYPIIAEEEKLEEV
ncbi:hypothetical protein BTM36_03655, partial [Herbaspirillum sp. VT-16-41]